MSAGLSGLLLPLTPVGLAFDGESGRNVRARCPVALARQVDDIAPVSEPPQVTQPTAKPPSRPSPRADALKKRLIYAAAALAIVGTAYGIGRAQGAAQLREAQSRFEERTTEHERKSQQLQESLTAAERVRAHLEARRRLHRAMLALDERNFGIAHAHVQAAASMLDRGGDGGDARALSEELRAFRLVATEDLGSQRQPLLKWALRIDELEPLQEP
jgi:hypothetical protein